MDPWQKAKWAAEFFAAGVAIIGFIRVISDSELRTARGFIVPTVCLCVFILLYRAAPAVPSTTQIGTGAPPALGVPAAKSEAITDISQSGTRRVDHKGLYEDARQRLAEGRYAEAVGRAQNYVREVPRDNEGHRLLGAAYGGLGNWEGASLEYQAVIDNNPADMDAYMGLAIALEKLRDFVGAREAYRIVAGSLRSTPSHRDRAAQRLKALGE
jgi:hypothetical protein